MRNPSFLMIRICLREDRGQKEKKRVKPPAPDQKQAQVFFGHSYHDEKPGVKKRMAWVRKK